MSFANVLDVGKVSCIRSSNLQARKACPLSFAPSRSRSAAPGRPLQHAFISNGTQLNARMAAAVDTVVGSRLAGIDQAPPDPILGITDAFRRDTDPRKMNLGVGAYRTEELKPLVLNVVRKAEKKLIEEKVDHEYLGIDGLPAFKKATIELLLGANHPAIAEGRIATIQSLSGTGSLRIGAAFLARFFKDINCFVSDPTWGNHYNIFRDVGLDLKNYRYYDKATVGLDFAGMMEDLKNFPDGSVIVLHGCAHNPTGIDPTKEQWEQIADLCIKKNHIPFFDVAYQGFASGSLDEDAFAPRLFIDKGLEVLVAQSYSKNLGLYGERVGALSFILSENKTPPKVLSQLKRLARPMYSNPPAQGARIVAEVVGDEAMFAEWKSEMEGMAGRIKSVRQKLYDELVKVNTDRDWSFILRQIGMFSFTGLTNAQVTNMTNKHHIYMTFDGRISLAGLAAKDATYLAAAIDDSIRNF